MAETAKSTVSDATHHLDYVVFCQADFDLCLQAEATEVR